MRRLQNRQEAGQLLTHRLLTHPLLLASPPVVVALPRGGVPVAFEIAKALRAPLEVLVVRKLGVPWQPEVAFGAIATGNVQILNQKLIAEASISKALIEAIVRHELEELKRRERLYQGNRIATDLHNRTVILVDDGIATGATIFAAVEALTRRKPAHLLIAVPVAPPKICKLLKASVDDVISLVEMHRYDAVGSSYYDFPQVSDEAVKALLKEARSALTRPPMPV